MSFSAYNVSKSLGNNFNVSCFLRSLKPDGLLFQLRRPTEEEGEEVYFSIHLGMGRVLVSSLPNTVPLTAPVFVTTGERQLLQVEVQHRQVIFEHAGLRYGIGEIPEVNINSGDQAYVGGLPGDFHSDMWGGYYKGCLQDLRLASVYLDGDAWNIWDEEKVLLPSDAENVKKGCVSDDTCKVRNSSSLCSMIHAVVWAASFKAHVAFTLYRPGRQPGCLNVVILYQKYKTFLMDHVTQPKKSATTDGKKKRCNCNLHLLSKNFDRDFIIVPNIIFISESS